MKVSDILQVHPPQRRLVEATLASLGLTEEAAIVARGERYQPQQIAVASDIGLVFVALDVQSLQVTVEVIPWQRVTAPALAAEATLRMERVELAVRLTFADPEMLIRASDHDEIEAVAAFWAACASHTSGSAWTSVQAQSEVGDR